MASRSALLVTQIRRVSSATSKALGRLQKFAGTLNGGGGIATFNGGRTITPRRVPLGGFPAAPRPPTNNVPVGPGPDPVFIPETAALPNLCTFIPEPTLRAICEAGRSIVFRGDPRAEKPVIGQEGECDPGFIRFMGTCIAPGDLFPGGDPLFQPEFNGQVVQGGFGLPAMTPADITRVTRKCPKGMVLGIDDLCYAKAILPGRSKLRKWRRPPRPPITRRDTVAIRRAAGARDRVFELAKDVGLHVAKSPHRKKAKK